MKHTIYLIDTENVGNGWKALLEEAAGGDRLLFFYTENSPGLPYADLQQLLNSKLRHEFLCCHTGKNGLDFQLISYMGYLLQGWRRFRRRIVIVSNDTGFDPALRFWTERGFTVERRPSVPVSSANRKSLSERRRFKPKDPMLLQEQKQRAKPVRVKPVVLPPKETKAPPEVEILTPSADRFLRMLPSILPDCSDSELLSVSALLKRHTYRQKQEIHLELVQTFGEEPGTVLYRRLRPHLFDLYQSTK